MIRERAEAKSTIEELYHEFDELRAEDDLIRDILYARHEPRLRADMAKLKLPSIVASASPAIDFHAHNAQAELTESLEFRCVARRPKDKAAADDLELAAGYSWSKLDRASVTLDAIRRIIVTRPFAALWLGFKAFQLPGDGEDQEANQDYRESLFPLYAEVDNGRLTAFKESQGKVTIAVRKMVKPFLSLVTEYDKQPKKARRAGTIWDEDFPELRMGFSVAEGDEGLLVGKKATMWRLDDGVHICEYVTGIDEGTDLAYPILVSDRANNEPIANPFGAVSMSFACGFWNPDADKPADRYEAFLRGLALKSYDIDRLRSVLASLSASIPTPIIQAKAAEVLPQLDGKGPKEIDDFLSSVMVREIGKWTMVLGEAIKFDMPVPALLEREIAEAKEEYAHMVPYHLPDDITIRNTTAGALATAVETRQRPYGLPKTSISRCVYETIQKVFHFYREQKSSAIFNVSGVANPEKMYGVSVGGRRQPAGKRFEIGPAQLGADAEWYILSVQHLDESPSARAARRLEAAERKANESILEADRLELNGETNVALFTQQKQVEKWKEMYFAAASAAALRTAEVHAAAVTGIPPDQLLAAQTPGAPPAGPATNGNQPPNSSTQSYIAQPANAQQNLQPMGVQS